MSEIIKNNIKEIEYKTIEERKSDVKNIIKELNHFGLNYSYMPIKKLYTCFKDFIDNGNFIKVNIPFPMINRRIKGKLMPNKKGDSIITLIHEQFN
jgi:hypothetical protein|uniref:Uncharacterized protein n=1 Tax=viral metagenome TaxID=1070528 RepID=A0A6C0IQC3_9ZZZZ